MDYLDGEGRTIVDYKNIVFGSSVPATQNILMNGRTIVLLAKVKDYDGGLNSVFHFYVEKLSSSGLVEERLQFEKTIHHRRFLSFHLDDSFIYVGEMLFGSNPRPAFEVRNVDTFNLLITVVLDCPILPWDFISLSGEFFFIKNATEKLK